MPIILTDDIFIKYGGATGTTSEIERQTSYDIAEDMVSQFLHTPLEISQVSGVYNLPNDLNKFSLDHTWVDGIDQIGYYSCDTAYMVTGTVLGRYYSEQGVVPLALFHNGLYGWPDDGHFIFSYNAGLPTGTFSKASYMMGLVQYAQLVLFELTDPSSLEGGVGDIGVQAFGDNGYSEQRKKLISTLLGNSNRVHGIRRFLSGLRRRKGVNL